jgi:hypothetical protein
VRVVEGVRDTKGSARARRANIEGSKTCPALSLSRERKWAWVSMSVQRWIYHYTCTVVVEHWGEKIGPVLPVYALLLLHSTSRHEGNKERVYSVRKV